MCTITEKNLILKPPKNSHRKKKSIQSQRKYRTIEDKVHHNKASRSYKCGGKFGKLELEDVPTRKRTRQSQTNIGPSIGVFCV